VKDPDAATARFREKFACYRAVRGLSFSEMADLVERDQIDILVAQGGHSEDNCLAVLARQPAPIQVDYGGIDTNGMSQIAYRLSDAVLDPPELTRYYTEETLLLPGGLASLRPPMFSPLVGPLPAHRNGYVTFGSFNNNAKINGMVLDMWAGVLVGSERSRLILKFPGGCDAGVRDYYVAQLARRGVSKDRVTIYGLLSDYDHLDCYNQVDLVLDTFPYNGCITLQEGFWMGVPAVTLVGEPYVSRVGLTLLTRLGLEVFAAQSPAEYVAKATRFGASLEALASLRRVLRERMVVSPLCDPGRLARDLEQAFRLMWRRWCCPQASSGSPEATPS
jgi:protein O-GlcNAc transferase